MFKQKGFKEISLLWMGSLLGAFTAFLTQVLLARHLSLSDFGLFSSAFATIALITPLAGFGVAQYWLKAFGEEGFSALRWMKGSYQFIIKSTFAVLAVLFIWIFLGPNNTNTQIVLALLSSFLISQVMIELLSVRFQLEEKYLLLALWQLTPHLLRLTLILFITFTPWFEFDLKTAAFIYFAVSLLVVLTGIKSLIQMIRGNINLKGHDKQTPTTALVKPSSLAIMSNAWPFGLAAFFYIIYSQSNIILLKYILGDEAAGIYNVAFNVMAAVSLFPGVIYQKYLLPKIHRWANHDTEKFYSVYRYGIKSMLLFGIIAMVGIWITSFWAIPLLFGKKYVDAVGLLNILALSAPVIFLYSNSGAMLVTKENMLRKVKYMAFVAMVNIFLNIIFISIYSIQGAAFAALASYSLLLYLYNHGINKYVFSHSKA